MSSTTSPLIASVGSSAAVASVIHAQTSSVTWVSQKLTVPQPLRQEQVDQQDRAGRREQHDLGQHDERLSVIIAVPGAQSLLFATCASRSVTDVCITSTKGFG